MRRLPLLPQVTRLWGEEIPGDEEEGGEGGRGSSGVGRRVIWERRGTAKWSTGRVLVLVGPIHEEATRVLVLVLVNIHSRGIPSALVMLDVAKVPRRKGCLWQEGRRGDGITADLLKRLPPVGD